MSSSRVFWGLLILMAGVAWLLSNFGILPANFWPEVWRLWPLLLILWGLSLLAGRQEQSGVIISVVSVIVIAACVAVFGWLYNNGKILQESVTSNISEDLGSNISNGEIKLKFGAAKLEISGGSDKFVEGSVDTFTKVDIKRSTSMFTQKLDIDQISDRPIFWSRNGRNNIDLKLNESIPYELNLDTGASQFKLDLSRLKITALSINGGATSGEVRLSNLINECNVEIASGASSFTLKVPRDSALKIDNKAGLSSNNFKSLDLNQDGNLWQTNDYNSAEKRIKITFSAGVSSINIEKY